MEENTDKWQKPCVTHRRITQGQQEDPVTLGAFCWQRFSLLALLQERVTTSQ